jgi:serine/threonine protein kinase
MFFILFYFILFFKDVWKIFSQCLLALAALEHFNMIHRDIKGGNVFIRKDNTVKIGSFFLFLSFFICIGDFGMARQVSFDSHKVSTLLQGTLYEI